MPEATQAALRSELGIEPGDASEPVALEQVELPAARPIPDAVRTAAGGELLSGDEDRIRRAAGRSYPDLVRLRTGKLELAPDAVAVPSSAEQVAARPGGLRRRGSRRCALRGRIERGRRPRRHRGLALGGALPGPGGNALGRDRPHLADGAPWPRPARARGRERPGRARRHPRALPAVLRAGDDRGLRGDPLGRPGLVRLRALRRDGHRDRDDRARGLDAHAADPAHRRRGRRCASSCSAPREPLA